MRKEAEATIGQLLRAEWRPTAPRQGARPLAFPVEEEVAAASMLRADVGSRRNDGRAQSSGSNR
jgi:hypothetical protein